MTHVPHNPAEHAHTTTQQSTGVQAAPGDAPEIIRTPLKARNVRIHNVTDNNTASQMNIRHTHKPSPTHKVAAPHETSAQENHDVPLIEAPETVSVGYASHVGTHKVKGTAQMLGGTALAVAGIPLCILPGPGLAALVGGTALVSKGHRNYTGRAATPLEEKMDTAVERLGSTVKNQVSQVAHRAAQTAPEAARATAQTFEHTAHAVGEMAHKGFEFVARKAPEVAHSVAENAPATTEKVINASKALSQTTAQAAAQGTRSVFKAGNQLLQKYRAKN